MRTVLVLLALASAAFAQADKATVKVCRMWYEDDKDGVTHAEHRFGTGFVIWSGKDKDGDPMSYILTNSHVAPEESVYNVISYNDGPKEPHFYRCEWIGATPEADRDKDGDLALLRCYHKFPAVSLAKDDPPTGAELVSWGFPKSGPLAKNGGKYLGNEGPGGKEFVYGDYLTLPGSSGSGVYYKDKLVAVSFGITNKTDRNGFNYVNPDGTPVFVPPAWMVPRKKIEVFLNRQLPKEMGVTSEKGPQPTVLRDPRPCEQQGQGR